MRWVVVGEKMMRFLFKKVIAASSFARVVSCRPREISSLMTYKIYLDWLMSIGEFAGLEDELMELPETFHNLYIVRT